MFVDYYRSWSMHQPSKVTENIAKKEQQSQGYPANLSPAEIGYYTLHPG